MFGNKPLTSSFAIHAKLCWTAVLEPSNFLKFMGLRKQTKYAFPICEIYTKNIILSEVMGIDKGEFAMVLPEGVSEENLDGCAFLTRFTIDKIVKNKSFRQMTYEEAMKNPLSIHMPDAEELPLIKQFTKVVGVSYEMKDA
uniref:Uncharacterized protein n=1 Tax=Clandestinovirus TaxID=2831644 RepID=A0A8F8PNA7_9VIRU|nr:hypothetical protein KOM_12_369 [Clandestinovirus]